MGTLTHINTSIRVTSAYTALCEYYHVPTDTLWVLTRSPAAKAKYLAAMSAADRDGATQSYDLPGWPDGSLLRLHRDDNTSSPLFENVLHPEPADAAGRAEVRYIWLGRVMPVSAASKGVDDV